MSFPWTAKRFLGDTLSCARRESEDCINQMSSYLREGKRDVIDMESLFEYDGALFRLYFQPTLYLMESCEIRGDSRLLCGPVARTSCWCRKATAFDNDPVRGWQCRKLFIKESLLHKSSWKLISLRNEFGLDLFRCNGWQWFQTVDLVSYANVLLCENLQNTICETSTFQKNSLNSTRIHLF